MRKLFRSLDQKPPNPKNGDKYNDRQKGKIYIFAYGRWIEFKENVKISIFD